MILKRLLKDDIFAMLFNLDRKHTVQSDFVCRFLINILVNMKEFWAIPSSLIVFLPWKAVNFVKYFLCIFWNGDMILSSVILKWYLTKVDY